MKKLVHSLRKGFTLVELAISVAIFALITSVVVFNYADFNNNLIMTNYAYEVSLATRQAQVYGLSVKGQGTGQGFDAVYGVSFDMARPSQVIIFADNVEDGRYVPSGDGSGDAWMEAVTFNRGVVVSDLCVDDGAGDVCGQEAINITFRRPDPDARILVGDASSGDDPHSIATVKIRAPNGKERSIIIRVTGQVSVVVPVETQTEE
jgi:prepilin-type N-terminal cleavage/methylation domain-containing protein